MHSGCHMNIHYCAMSTLLSYHSSCPLVIKHILLIFEIGFHYAALARLCRPGWPPSYRDLPVSASGALGLPDVSKIDSHYVAQAGPELSVLLLGDLS